LAKAIQDLDFNMEAIASTTSATSTPESQSFATSFFQNIFAKIGAWLADATNGLTTVFANAFHAKQEICVDNQCLTANDVAALLQVVHGQQAGSNNGSSGSSGSGSSSGSNGGTASTTPPIDISSPVVTVTGTNPAEIPIGSTYSDFGATVTDTNADGTVNNNLGYKTILDGTEVQTITIDTTATSTHTIIYRATDGAGNVGEASRTVDVVTQ
jgi:hypothetical protein